jgi:hypothetical protein
MACKKHSDSCLRVIVNDFGDIDLGACIWCKARSVGCSTAQRRGRGGVTQAKDEEDPTGKRKASDIESEASNNEEPSPKKVKLRSVIEDSEEEWEEWEGIEDKGDWPKESGEEQEVEEVWEVTEEVREEVREEVMEEVRKMDRREAKRARTEARRSERKARRLERSEEMKDLIHVVVDLGNKVDRFVEEVRVSNVLRNRADREYLEERRRWYFSDRMLHARDWEKDSDVDSEGHSG